MIPANEKEVIELYKLVQEQLGWRIVHLQTAFPDAVIENASGQQLVVEFEHTAKGFLWHGHDLTVTHCDLIICWANNWPDAPLPVWGLKECLSRPVSPWQCFVDWRRGKIYEKEVSKTQGQVRELVDQAQRQIQKLEAQTERQKREVGLEQKAQDLATVLDKARNELRCARGQLELMPKIVATSTLEGVAALCFTDGFDYRMFVEFWEEVYRVPGVREIQDHWRKEMDLRNLSIETGKYLDFDISHVGWTGKGTEWENEERLQRLESDLKIKR